MTPWSGWTTSIAASWTWKTRRFRCFRGTASSDTDLVARATRLCGEYRSAMCLGKQRVDHVPGRWQLTFTPDGAVSGSGRDIWGTFDLSGFWSGPLLTLRK